MNIDKGPINIVITDPSVCFVCETPGLDPAEKFCTHCGFPQNGDISEQRRYISQKRMESISLKYDEKDLYKSQWYLYAVAFLNFLSGIIIGEPDFIFVSAFFCVVYIGLGIWSRFNPFAALLVGLLIYITMWIISIIANPSFIILGIIIKIIIIGGLVRGIINAGKIERAKRNV